MSKANSQSAPGGRELAIAARAYAIWEEKGRPDGHDLDHWLQAERELPGASATVRARRRAASHASKGGSGDPRYQIGVARPERSELPTFGLVALRAKSSALVLSTFRGDASAKPRLHQRHPNIEKLILAGQSLPTRALQDPAGPGHRRPAASRPYPVTTFAGAPEAGATTFSHGPRHGFSNYTHNHRSSASRPTDAGTEGATATRNPVRSQAR